MNIQNLMEEIEGYYPDIPSNLLPLYINMAMTYFMSITNLSEVPNKASSVIIQLVVVYWNKFGYEGLTSSSQGGNTLNWGSDLSQDIKDSISSFLSIRWV